MKNFVLTFVFAMMATFVFGQTTITTFIDTVEVPSLYTQAENYSNGEYSLHLYNSWCIVNDIEPGTLGMTEFRSQIRKYCEQVGMPLAYYNDTQNGLNNEAILHWSGYTTIKVSNRILSQDEVLEDTEVIYSFNKSIEDININQSPKSSVQNTDSNNTSDEEWGFVSTVLETVEIEGVQPSKLAVASNLNIQEVAAPEMCIEFANAKEINDLIRENLGRKIAAQKEGDIERAEYYREQYFSALDARDQMYADQKAARKQARQERKNKSETKARTPNRRKGNGQGQTYSGRLKKTKGKSTGLHPGRCKK